MEDELTLGLGDREGFPEWLPRGVINHVTEVDKWIESWRLFVSIENLMISNFDFSCISFLQLSNISIKKMLQGTLKCPREKIV